LIGLGVSSIATVGPIYCQNAKSLGNYYAAIDAGRLAIERGFVLNDDDLMTRDVIQSLMCSFEFDLDVFAERYGVDFREYFEPEWDVLEEMAEQGLVKLSPNRIKVTSAGRFLIRNVCMVFDAYLSPQAAGFSKAI
jgi:oxygen-independent coproporphyrinogen-3 oxidase